MSKVTERSGLRSLRLRGATFPTTSLTHGIKCFPLRFLSRNVIAGLTSGVSSARGLEGVDSALIMCSSTRQHSPCSMRNYVSSTYGLQSTWCVVRNGHDLSDHYPIEATLNAPSDYCGPDRARSVVDSEFENADRTARVAGTDIWIEYPEGAQWFLINDPGTYTIATRALSEEMPEFEVYSTQNLSKPLAVYRDVHRTFGDTSNGQVEGPTFAVPNGPFFIKVFYADEKCTGPYELLIPSPSWVQ